MKTYKVIVKVSTPVDSLKFELIVIAPEGRVTETVEREFPKHEPQMTPDNECNFYVDSVEEYSEGKGVVLSCERVR